MTDTNSISAVKAKLLQEKSTEKQVNLGGSEYLRQRLQTELAPIPEVEIGRAHV